MLGYFLVVGYHWLILFSGTDPFKIEVKEYLSYFPGGTVVKTPHFQSKRVWIQSLVGEQGPTCQAAQPKE